MKRKTLLLLAAATIAGSLASPTAALACHHCGKAVGCEPTCSYSPCIKYVETRRYLRCFECSPKAEMVLQVMDPCTCCLVDVPVCIPACCVGAPCVDSKVGRLGNGKIFYTWDCGFEIKVVVTKRGDIAVVYLGR